MLLYILFFDEGMARPAIDTMCDAIKQKSDAPSWQAEFTLAANAARRSH
tara:strand:- start:355 stop:501 length:147 start_codon:yes stop_codon:yes gene_type:complete